MQGLFVLLKEVQKNAMGEGWSIYQIERCILKNGKRFNDGSHIIYVNGTYQDESPLEKLMQDFFCTDPSDMNYGILADRVRFFKEIVAKEMLSDGVLLIEKIAKYSKLSVEEVKKLGRGEPA